MIHTKVILRWSSSLYSKSTRGFAGLANNKKPTPKDLDKYDLIIIGSNIGGILSRQFEQLTKNYYKIMVVFDRSVNEQLPIRGIYEQGKASKNEYLINAKLAIDTQTAHSDGVGVDKILPDENAVVLRNGRKIGYDHLVIAMGLNEDFEAIKGFEEAWEDLQHPVFTHRDHPNWRANDTKHQRWIYNYSSGNAFFCIPSTPYRGEVSSFNFLTAAQAWKGYARTGRLSPLYKFSVVNANNSFCQHFDVADRFIKEKLNRSGVNVDFGDKLVEIDKRNFKVTFENVRSGERTVKDYSNLYVIPPTKPHQALVDAGLVSEASNNLLDVDHKTLRHRKYNNIFGLGEVNNLPTTKGFWNNLHQLHVVRHNLQRSLNGQGLNAFFDGRSKVPLYLGEDSLTFVEHYYDQKADSMNLIDGNGGLISKMRYKSWSTIQKKEFMNLYLGKMYGPPYYLFNKSFSGPEEAPEPKTKEVSKGAPEFTPIRKSDKK